MTDCIVSKFGGSSVANAEQIKKVRRIVQQDPRRRVIVVSAPGRSEPNEYKITDHLINIATDGVHLRQQRIELPVSQCRSAVLQKFTDIADDLDVDAGCFLEALAQDLDTELSGDKRTAFLASRGEHYNALIIAAYFQQCGMAASARLPEHFGLRVGGDYLNARTLPTAYENMASLATFPDISVVPGFYGVTEDDEVAVFSRGGSDLTGGEIAFALDAEKYENWTDVSGVYEVDPRVISGARVITRLTFKEIRLLSSKGFNVFHLDAMLRCRDSKIPIHIRNTDDPMAAGTLILNERVPEEDIVGIARLDNMAYIYLEKDMLGEEVGFTADLLQIFQEFRINTYHYPTDKDDMAVLVNQDDLLGSINDLRRRIDRKLKPDFMNVEYNLSVLTPVGIGLKNNAYPIIQALGALGNAHIPIAMIDQSPSQICFHIAVANAVADDALQILYDTLLDRS
ncbi:aspartate kinase [Kineobactrum sediminis]|uniref:Aspartokinase n=1 Tax=Kineobactrum sediminis TaxID=1905677 RepID=A0A2N5Y6I6_9GAMM|nr:aspartate kinase [Kineobactrum sediminis]PLW84006.1 aspartate kinase [Kineobactrum sediminis]